MANAPLISIVVRTKNEEKWIESCLNSIFEQDYENFEVILVDNESSDETLNIVKNFNVKTVHYPSPFIPGQALNAGIKEAKGEFVAMISGHCVPKDSQWLSNLYQAFDDPQIAGVYGRQEPLSYSSPLDKRDLWTIFGLDKRIQRKDTFFHNANSMIRKSLWDKIPFSETSSNIEDRIWAKEVIKRGYFLAYEPSSSVYHWHGIHHDGKIERCQNVIRIIEDLDLINEKDNIDIPDKINFLIPIKGEGLADEQGSLLEMTISQIKKSNYVKDIIVTTDSEKTKELAIKLGAKVPFLRPKELSREFVGIHQVISFSIRELKKLNLNTSYTLVLQEIYPFRDPEFLDQFIHYGLNNKVHGLIPISEERNTILRPSGEDYEVISEKFIPKKIKDPYFITLPGLGLLSRTYHLEEEVILSDNTDFYKIKNVLSPYRINSNEELKAMRPLLEKYKY